MKIGIIAADDNKRAKELCRKIQDYLKEKGHQAVLDLKETEAVVVLGGDGTLIHSACENVELGVPFVGVNVGTLGFLTAADGDEWQKVVDVILSGKLVVSERMTLEANISRLTTNDERLTQYRALNEIVIKGMYRVVNLEIAVNNQKFLSVVGDGIIVATPTGSTAYSLSAGGPIVDPEVDSLLITPVNAHGLPIPSVVLSPEDVVEIKVTKGEDVSLIIDGQEHTKVESGQTVKVSRGKYRVKLGYFDEHHFLKALNSKFGLTSRTTA